MQAMTIISSPTNVFIICGSPAAHKVKPTSSFANIKSARGKFHWPSQWVEEMNEEAGVVLIVTSTRPPHQQLNTKMTSCNC